MVSGGCQCSHVLLFGGVWCKRWSQEDASVLVLLFGGVWLRDGLRRMPMLSCLLFGGVWCNRWSQEDASVLMCCCLVESGVRDGLRRMPVFSCVVVWWSLV